jgi:predicted kinase
MTQSAVRSDVILITGIMAAGKSTIAQHLAERLPASVHLRGDVFRRMIVNGRVEMEPEAPAELAEAAYAQLRLRYQLAVNAAATYCSAGFTVIYQDIILGQDLVDVIEKLKRSDSVRTLYVIVLCPSPEVVAQREAGRHKVGYGTWTPEMLDQGLRKDTPHTGWWLDTSTLTVEATVDTILAQLNQAVV